MQLPCEKGFVFEIYFNLYIRSVHLLYKSDFIYQVAFD